MELIYKGKVFSYRKPIAIECSDGKKYVCRYNYFPRMSFTIYEGDEPVVKGAATYSAVWTVTDTKANKPLFTTCGKWGRLTIEVDGKKIKENEFQEEFGWSPISCSGFYRWGLRFPKKEKYLMELAYGFLKDRWQGD
tara:strand:+ start:392 stop:802 length:411 start_codon:yes stop_codon:yes gene_type:complete